MIPKPLLLARLTGTQEAMGAQHGRLVADDAARLFEFYRTMPERSLAGDLAGPAGVAGRWLVRTLATAWQARLVKTRPAELAARTAAFIGAVRDTHPQLADSHLALATMDSMQNCVSLVARAALGPFARPITARVAAAAIPACSTAIAWGRATHDGELMFARNFDFPGVGVWDAAPAFVVCAPDRGQRYGFFTTRGADTPVVTVVNQAGLVLAPHTRWHRGVGWSGAMIVDLVHDIARRAETLADAIAIARERPISSSWGLAIGSARERSAIVVEIAGPAVEIVRAPGETLVCANRYRTPALQAGQIAASSAWAQHSERRERRLRELVEHRTALTAQDLAGFLGDRQDAGLRRHLGGTLNQAGNVHCAVVAPLARRAWVGVDQAPCCEGTWAELGWDWDGPAGAWELGGTEHSGFTATARQDLVAPHDEASRHVHEAVSRYEATHDVAAARAAIDRAVAADPDDPSLRLAALWLALEARAPDRAVVHAHAGLAKETDPYRRGQLLLWGARAADPALAKRWLAELAALSGDGLGELQAASRKRFRGRPHINLMMQDAY